MTKNKDMNIGTAGEHLVIADLLLNGFEAFGTAQGMNYDVVLETGNRLLKLQVKTTAKKRITVARANPIYFFHIKRAGKNGIRHYKKGDFDGYALVALDKRIVFYVAFDECKSNSICVRDREMDYSGKRGGGRPNGIYYQEMTLDRFIKKLCKK